MSNVFIFADSLHYDAIKAASLCRTECHLSGAALVRRASLLGTSVCLLNTYSQKTWLIKSVALYLDSSFPEGICCSYVKIPGDSEE